MTFSLISVGAATVASNVAVTIPLPPTYVAGDLLVLYDTLRTTARNVVAPAGWTLLVTWDGQHLVYARTATGTDAAPNMALSAGSTSGVTHIGQMAAFRSTDPLPADLHTLVTASAVTSTAVESGITTPALDVPRDGSLVLMFGHRWDAWDTLTHPSGFTPVGAFSSTLGNNAGLAWSYATRDAAADVAASSYAVTFVDGPTAASYSAVASLGGVTGTAPVVVVKSGTASAKATATGTTGTSRTSAQTATGHATASATNVATRTSTGIATAHPTATGTTTGQHSSTGTATATARATATGAADAPRVTTGTASARLVASSTYTATRTTSGTAYAALTATADTTAARTLTGAAYATLTATAQVATAHATAGLATARAYAVARSGQPPAYADHDLIVGALNMHPLTVGGPVTRNALTAALTAGNALTVGPAYP